MNKAEIDALMEGVSEVVSEYVSRESRTLSTLLGQRIEAVEKREPIPGPAGKDGRDGRDADGAHIYEAVHSQVSITMAETTEALTRHCEAVIASIPKPQDGSPGKDGKDADFDLTEFVETFCQGLADVE